VRRSTRQVAPRAGQRRRAIAVVRSPLARQIVALGLALSVVALSLAYPLRGYLQQQSAERQAVAEQHDLETQIVDLKAQIAALKDPAYIRAEAKRRLQYVTPGDTVYVVKLPPSVTAASTGSAAATSPGGVGDAATAAGTTGTAGESSGPTEASDTTEPWYESLWGTLSGGAS
jgi:cell division protein FtsB